MSGTLEPQVAVQSGEKSRIRNLLQKLRCPSAEIIVSLIIGLFVLVNFWNIREYGISYDEPNGIARGEDADAIISSFLGGTSYLDPHRQFQNHPTFYAYLDYKVAMALVKRSVEFVPAIHALNVITAAVGLIILFLFARQMFNSRVACLAVLVLALNARFIGNAHFNGKDIPVMVLSMLTLYFLYLALKDGRTRYWILAAIAMGMSIDTKLDALIVLPIMIIPIAVQILLERKKVAIPIRSALMFIYVSALTVYALWPLLWERPFFMIKALLFWGGKFNRFDIMYLGQGYPIDKLPWHYMPLHLIVSAPVIVVLFGIIGAVVLWRHYRQHEKRFEIILLAAWILLPLLPRLLGLMLQYGGMRQVFIVVPALAIISAVGFDACINWIATRFKRWTPGMAFCCAVSVWLLVECKRAHPYEGSYVNEFARLFFPRDKLADYFDFYSWCAPLRDGIFWLNKNAPQGAVVKVVMKSWLQELLNAYPLREDIQLTDAEPADFMMKLSELPVKVDETSPVYVVKCYDTTLLTIVKLPNGTH